MHCHRNLVVFPGEAPLISTHKLSGMIGKVFQVPQNAYPMLVTFTNINDAKSVKEVEPYDLAAAFGQGYALKSITLEITDEKVTEGVVEKVLVWLVKLNGSYLNGEFTSKNAPLGLHGGNFKSGYSK